MENVLVSPFCYHILQLPDDYSYTQSIIFGKQLLNIHTRIDSNIRSPISLNELRLAERRNPKLAVQIPTCSGSPFSQRPKRTRTTMKQWTHQPILEAGNPSFDVTKNENTRNYKTVFNGGLILYCRKARNHSNQIIISLYPTASCLIAQGKEEKEVATFNIIICTQKFSIFDQDIGHI